MTLIYVLSPLICAVIGWLTNYIAVKMLFHPREPVGIGPLRIQGVFPKRQKALAENLGRLVEEELVSHNDLQQAMQQADFAEGLLRVADPYLDKLLDEKLPSLHPMAGMVLGGEMRGKLKNMFSEQLQELAPAVAGAVGKELEEKLDFKDLVRQKVEAFSMDKLEEILFSIMRREFRFIELVGGVLGFLIGVVQAAIFSLS